jgi:hypothetical protein
MKTGILKFDQAVSIAAVYLPLTIIIISDTKSVVNAAQLFMN